MRGANWGYKEIQHWESIVVNAECIKPTVAETWLLEKLREEDSIVYVYSIQ